MIFYFDDRELVYKCPNIKQKARYILSMLGRQIKVIYLCEMRGVNNVRDE